MPHCVGPAHMHCQNSFMSLVPRVFKFSFPFIEKWPNAWEGLTSLNEKWCKAEQACLTRWRKRKERSKRPFGVVWELKQNKESFGHFGVSSRESKTQKRESFSWRCGPKNREKHSESVREWKRKRRHFSLLKLHTRKINWWSSHGVFECYNYEDLEYSELEYSEER